MHNIIYPDVDSFLTKMCKSWHFFYFRSTDAIALSNFPTLSFTHQKKKKKKIPLILLGKNNFKKKSLNSFSKI